jgi:hypothetical protein
MIGPPLERDAVNPREFSHAPQSSADLLSMIVARIAFALTLFTVIVQVVRWLLS